MKVLVAAGGSGGHIFPAVSFAKELKKKGVDDILFISSKRRLDVSIMKNTEFRALFLSVNPMPFGFKLFSWLRFIINMTADVIFSVYIISTYRPDIVVGFGGYSSGAISKCSGLLGVPVVIHEQNVVPGRANIVLAGMAKRIAVSFPETEKFLPDGLRDKVVCTGNPLRVDELENDRDKGVEVLGLRPPMKTVLIMGGSQGSTFLNKTISTAVKLMCSRIPDGVQFIHITGKKDYESVKDYYSLNRLPVRVFSFLDDISLAYSVCDIAVSRAGAAALFELALYGIPMILVPYPNPKNNQRANAEYFRDKGAALLREEADITTENITEDITELLTDTVKYEKMSCASASLSRPEAGEQLALEVLTVGPGFSRTATI